MMAKTVFGMIFLLFGGLIFFNVLGLGWLVRLVFSLVIIVYAINKLKQTETSKQKGFWIVILLFGMLLLFGGVHLLFGLLVGLSLIFVGFKIVKSDDRFNAPGDPLKLYGNTAMYEDAFDIEWNKRMKK